MSYRPSAGFLTVTGTIAAGVTVVVLLGARQPAYDPAYRFGRAAVAMDSVPASIAEAEAQGARHPRASATSDPSYPRHLPDSVLPGTADRKCVDVGDADWVRAGDFVAGPFALYKPSWWNGPPKLIWASAHQSRLRPTSLTIRTTPLDRQADARVFETRGLPVAASLIFGNEPHTRVMTPPAGGRWLLVATAGANWGCVVTTLP